MLSVRWGSKLKIPQNIQKESGKRILSPKKAQRQNLGAPSPLEETRCSLLWVFVTSKSRISFERMSTNIMRLQQNIEYRNRRGTDYVIINHFETSKRNWKMHPSVFWKKSFNVVQKCFQYVEGVSSKYPKNIQKESGKRILSPKKARRQNLWAPLEEKRFREFYRCYEFLSRPSRGYRLNGCRRSSSDCSRILSIMTAWQIFFPRVVCWITQKFPEHESKVAD